jgi:hypothetical protein
MDAKVSAPLSSGRSCEGARLMCTRRAADVSSADRLSSPRITLSQSGTASAAQLKSLRARYQSRLTGASSFSRNSARFSFRVAWPMIVWNCPSQSGSRRYVRTLMINLRDLRAGRHSCPAFPPDAMFVLQSDSRNDCRNPIEP